MSLSPEEERICARVAERAPELVELARTLLDGILSDSAQRQQVHTRAQTLVSELEAAPKSGGWRRRAKIGRRMRWYQTPDEADR